MDKEQVAAQDMVETVAEVDATGPTLVAESGDKAAESSGVTFDLATGEADIVPVYTDAGERVVQDEERYEAGPVLGAGGMGEVRLTRDARIGRHVAVKRLLEPLSGEATRRRFLREARIQGQLEHPAVVPVYDLDFDEQGQPFFTMKRVRGQTLSRILELSARGDTETRERFGRRRLLAAFTQACHAVHYAHVRGVVHRDLKPSNIMIGDYGEVYVLDWGVARVDKDASDEDERLPVVLDASMGLTRGGDLVGSLGYMAPEQMQGLTVDGRADVFALGVVLYEILTLRPFRKSESFPAMVARVTAGEKKRPRDVDPDIPPELDELCLRATAPELTDRSESVGELAEALERFLEGDRDREARRALARDHVQKARALASDEGADTGWRVSAMRHVVKALALDSDNVAAQKLMVELLVDVEGPAPAQAEEEYRVHVDRLRARGARMGALGFCAMLATFPLALWIGVRSWSAIVALTIAGVACAGFAFWSSRQRTRALHAHVLSLLTATLVGLVSSLAGPFALVPALAAGVLMFFVAHVTPSERRVAITLITLGALLPYGVEALGIFAPAYSFEPGQIVLYSRALAFSEGPMLLAFVYGSATFVALPALFAGWLHDELMAAQRRTIVQSWHLRELFAEVQSEG